MCVADKEEKDNLNWNYEPNSHQKNQGGPPNITGKGLGNDMRQIRGKIQQKKTVVTGFYSNEVGGMQY